MLLFLGLLLAADAPPTVDFAKEVAPILAEHCVSCHNPKAKKGGYDMSTYTAALKPGENGPAIVPGKIDESPLLEMIEGTTEPTMPKFAPLLIPQKREVIRRWIAAGCPCPTRRPQSAREGTRRRSADSRVDSDSHQCVHRRC